MLKKAVLRFEELTADEKIRAAAFHRERKILAEKSRLYTAKKEGHIEGSVETKRKIALNLLQMSMPVEQVAKVTGLSEEKIVALKH